MTSVAGRRWLGVLVLLLPAHGVLAAFNAGVAPPRFELTANPGETIRQVVTIINAGETVENYLVRSADWELQDGGGVVIHPPELQPGSCRPWTRIERREVSLAAGSTKRFRFEITVPADAAPGECRFALLVEAAPPEPVSDLAQPRFSVQLPISARLAVIVYLVIGDARPDLRVEGVQMREEGGQQLPVLSIRNHGNAHGRPAGFFKAEDARGESFDLVVVPYPVMPGGTSEVTLRPDPLLYGENPPRWQPPLRLRGTVETSAGDRTVDLTTR